MLENLNAESETDVASDLKESIDAVENSDKSISISSHSSYFDNYSNYIKTIPYDDKLLKLTYKERLVYGEMIKWVRYFDNIFRVIMPIIFLSYIGSLLAQEHI